MREPVSKVQEMLSRCSGALSMWSRNHEKNKEKVIKEKSSRLHRLQLEEGSHHIEERKMIQRELGQLLEMEDLKWRQRTKKN